MFQKKLKRVKKFLTYLPLKILMFVGPSSTSLGSLEWGKCLSVSVSIHPHSWPEALSTRPQFQQVRPPAKPASQPYLRADDGETK